MMYCSKVLAVLALSNNYSIYYDDGSFYPPWALAVGWLIALLSILFIPLVMIRLYLKKKGTFFEVRR